MNKKRYLLIMKMLRDSEERGREGERGERIHFFS
jgi:hypothetical protein